MRRISRRHLWDLHASGPDVQCRADTVVRLFGHTDDGQHPRKLRRSHQILRRADGVGAMLQINDAKIKPGVSHALDEGGVFRF